MIIKSYRIANLLTSINRMLVANPKLAISKEQQAQLDLLKRYVEDIQELPTRISEQQSILASCGKPTPSVSTEARPIIRRIRNNWSGYIHTLKCIKSLQEQLSRRTNIKAAVTALKKEIDDLIDSNTERLAKQYELRAALIKSTRPDRLVRKAMKIRAKAEIDRLAPLVQKLSDQLSTMTGVAERLAFEVYNLDKLAKEKAANKAAKAAKNVAAPVTAAPKDDSPAQLVTQPDAPAS